MRFAAAALIATLSLSARAKETVRIAFVGPLTGGNSAIGLGGRNSADLAVKLRNTDAKAKYQYELLVLDDECKPDAGVQMATKAGSDRTIVGGVTHYCSVVAMATVDTYHRFGLPAIVWGAVLPDITYAHDFKEIHRVNGTMITRTRPTRSSWPRRATRSSPSSTTRPTTAKATTSTSPSSSPRR